ncbi:Dabb family protein [Gemmatimonas sp.]|jgi:hypothetical protein|uniref:Dabb family protein n=1 Tax=Gemmatimonas sp. TaxID=1962908 RepID=UPI0037C19297
MLVHAVYFWLRDDLTADERAFFETTLRSLQGIPSATHCWIGQPAETDRPVIDRSYTWALVLAFDDMAAHDAYQVDPAHQAFVSGCKPLWKQVKIYDSI